MKRLFIAVDINPASALLDAFDNVRHTLRMEKINWVRKDQMHLTLAFLGDTEESVIAELITSMDTILESRHIFKLTLTRLGVFTIHDPRVLWVGCESEEELQVIKTETGNVLKALAFETDDRPFLPHLTLGRIKSMRHMNHLGQLIGVYKDTIFQIETVKKIILYESKLTTAGPEYTPVHMFLLK